MKTNMQKYPAYKDSGVEWLGEIPNHWAVKKVTHVFNKIGSGTTPTAGALKYYDNGQINWLQTGDLNDGLIVDTNKKITKKAITDFSTLKQYPKESIVIAMYGATIGKLGYLNIETTTNQACCVLGNPNTFSSKYGFYSFMNAKTSIISMSYGGGQPNISQDLVKSLRLSVPPLPEQTAIAAFLDRKTTLIDQAIGIKQKQIELLKERRQILINNAVTRGLNPNVKMKDSGVEWIGEIPEGWTITLLKRFCHKITDGSHHSPQTQFEGRNYISVKDVDSDGNINLINCKKINEKDFKELVRNGSQPKINDILLTKDGTIGRAAIVDKNNDFVALSSLGIITPDLKLVLPQYLSLYLTSEINVSQMFSLIAGSALTRLTIEKINNLITIIPPLNEQFNIINYVKPLVTKIATAISLKEQEIEKLKEYKATLINSAVTGKIKVC